MNYKQQNTYAAWAEAFTLFAKYAPEAFGEVHPAHDEIFAGPNPETVSAEDRARLDALGWREDLDNGCFCKFT